MRNSAVQTAEARLIAAAVQMFSTRGYTAVGIREIAREAGVTIGALYHYAPSKEALFLRILSEAYESAIAQLEAAADSADPAPDRVAAMIRTQVHGEVSGRDVWNVTKAELRALTPEARDRVVALRDRFESVWERVLEEGRASGDFVLDDAAITRFSLIKICGGVADWYRPDGRLTLDEICDLLVRQALALVGYSPVG
ncbi:TetR/AcrR family transcriptional regulator [Pseudonocardia sp. DLS-67]